MRQREKREKYNTTTQKHAREARARRDKERDN